MGFQYVLVPGCRNFGGFIQMVQIILRLLQQIFCRVENNIMLPVLEQAGLLGSLVRQDQSAATHTLEDSHVKSLDMIGCLVKHDFGVSIQFA
ncbi:hypothetical protein D3C76_1506310 [compost metagenome]